MTRFLHSSDWQLGMTRHFLAGEAQGRFTQARIDSIRAVGRVASERGAAFVVVAGDVFEHNQVARQTIARAFEALAAVGVPVFLLPGNHDPLDAASVYRSQTFVEGCPPHVVVLDDATPRAVPGVDGVDVIGAPWRGKRPLEDLVGRALRDAPPPDPGIVRIAVGHGIVDKLSPDRDDPAAIRLGVLEDALADGRVDYVALGDRHSATDVGTTGAVRYSGAPEPTDFDEVRPGRVLIVDVEPGARPRVDEVEVGRWNFRDVEAELDGPGATEALGERLHAMPDKERTVVRLSLSGSLRVAETAALDDMLLACEDRFASLRRWERHDRLVVRPDELDAAALGLGGYARQAWSDLASRARGDDDGARAARDALVLLHRLASEVEP